MKIVLCHPRQVLYHLSDGPQLFPLSSKWKMPSLSCQDSSWYKGFPRTELQDWKSPQHGHKFNQRKNLLIVSWNTESPVQWFPCAALFFSTSLWHTFPHAIAGLLFPNTIKKGVWKGTIQVLAPTGKIYYYYCFCMTWKRNNAKRGGILLWAGLSPSLPS